MIWGRQSEYQLQQMEGMQYLLSPVTVETRQCHSAQTAQQCFLLVLDCFSDLHILHLCGMGHLNASGPIRRRALCANDMAVSAFLEWSLLESVVLSCAHAVILRLHYLLQN